MFDLCIIGSGPAGLAAAITSAKKGAKVILLDKNKKAGKKLYATGNGKCNITNKNIDYRSHFHSEDTDYVSFLQKSFGDSPYEQVIEFMESLGLFTYETADGYVYPISNQASSVVWAMLDAIKQYDVKCDFKAEVTAIRKNNSCYIIDTLNGQITALQLIFACGGQSYQALGGTDSGYLLAKSLGHSITPVRPALCGFRTDVFLEQIAGVRARANVTLVTDDEKIMKEAGEVQFTNQGISGIAIFNLSALAGKALSEKKHVSIQLDYTYNIDVSKPTELYEAAGNRTILGALNGLFNDKLCNDILISKKIDGKQPLTSLTKQQFINLFHAFSCVQYDITGLYDFEQAQVCAGGIKLNEIKSGSFESKLLKDVYFIGEMLDIDGICGGYNITFAILSGICAGEHIYVKN